MHKGTSRWITLLVALILCMHSFIPLSTAQANTGSGIGDFVTRLYRLTLNRTPDTGGHTYWVNELRTGKKTGADVSLHFIFSREFQNKNLSDNDFLHIMYEAFFNRKPDAGGLKAWTQKLNEGYSRRYILANFVNSKEFANICTQFGIKAGTVALSKADTTLPKGTTFHYTTVFGERHFWTYYLFVNSKEITTPLIERNAIVYVPIKDIVTAMGDRFVLSGSTATITKRDSTRIVMTAKSITATVNGRTEQFNYRQDVENFRDYFPILSNNIFYVPMTDHFRKIFGYELKREFTPNVKRNGISGNAYTYHIGKAPDRYYVKSVYPFVDQYEIPVRAFMDGQRLRLLPVRDFSKISTKTTTRDPARDFIHMSKTMPDFIYNISGGLTYVDTPEKEGLKRFVADLESGRQKLEHSRFGYDTKGYYNYSFNTLYVSQTKGEVFFGVAGTPYDLWQIEDALVMDFNVPAALYHLLKFYAPNSSDDFMTRLRNGQLYWDKPVRYEKDKCTITIGANTDFFTIRIVYD